MTPAAPADPREPAGPANQSRWRRVASLALRWAKWLIIAVLVLPPLQAGLVRYVDPPVTLTMLSRSLRHWGETGERTLPAYRWVDLEDLPRSVPIALLSTEDRRFFLHSGFEMGAIRRAWARNRENPKGRIVGASTISQQVSRNVFLWQRRSWVRKGLEAWYTVWLELLVPKQRILELYVNVAEMGPMTFGIQAASQRWFSKPASRLRLPEAALIAALLPNPQAWTPRTPHVQRRAAWIVRAPATLPR